MIKFSPLDKGYPPSRICPHITRTEIKTFKKCQLGMSFYRDVLVPALTVVPDYVDYVRGTSYAEGDVILWYDQLLTSLVDNNTTDPCEESDDWEAVKKFTDDYLNILWEDYLREYLAFSIVGTSITYGTYTAGAKGLTKYSEDYRENVTGLTTVERVEKYDYKSELLNDAETVLINMLDFLTESHLAGITLVSSTDYIKRTCKDSCPDLKRSRGRVMHFLN